MEFRVCITRAAVVWSIEYGILCITLVEEYTNMKDELPSNFKHQPGDADDKTKEDKKDDATPTNDGEDTPTAEGLVKTAAAAALVSAAVKAKVSVVICYVVNHTHL